MIYRPREIIRRMIAGDHSENKLSNLISTCEEIFKFTVTQTATFCPVNGEGIIYTLRREETI